MDKYVCAHVSDTIGCGHYSETKLDTLLDILKLSSIKCVKARQERDVVHWYSGCTY